jgi:ribosome-associated protein
MTATRPKTKRTARAPAPKKTRTGPGALTKIAVAALEDMKAVNVKILDVRKLTDFADTLIVATGNSDRHVKSIADRVIERCREAGHRAYGVEGQKEGEWVLVDLQDLVVHVMLPRIREFYGLEKLWDMRPARREPSVA